MNSDNNTELYSFITEKCSNVSIDEKIAVFYSTRATIQAITHTLKYCKNKFSIDYINNISIQCSEIVNIVYWTIILYSNNIKLAMFMTDRATMLFNEYINISYLYTIEKTTINDIKLFIINKTIAPLHISNNAFNYKLYNLANYFSNFLMNIFSYLVYIDSIDNIDCYDILESISSILVNISIKLCVNDIDYIVYRELNSILVNNTNFSIDNITYATNLIKLKLELSLYVYKIINSLNNTEEIVDKVLEKLELDIFSKYNNKFLSVNNSFDSDKLFNKCKQLVDKYLDTI
jgi:hypothetical protein